jgi:hypothetical protein
VVFKALLDGGGGSVVTALLVGDGDGDGHTLDLVSGETWPASLASVLGARVLMGLLVRRPWWGVRHQYDFDRFIVIIFLVGNGNLDHTLDSGDPFFSLPRTR